MLEKNVLILMGSHRPYLLIGILTKGRKTSAKTYSNSELEGPMGGSLLAEALPPRLVKIPVGPRGTKVGVKSSENCATGRTKLSAERPYFTALLH
jgi:hypothetical protein